MTAVVLVCAVLLAVAAILAVVRVERGPSMLDRTIALDVLTTTLVAAVGLEAAWSRRTDTIPVLVALSLVGFVGSVTIARFASREPPGEGRVRSPEEVARDDAAGAQPAGTDRLPQHGTQHVTDHATQHAADHATQHAADHATDRGAQHPGRA